MNINEAYGLLKDYTAKEFPDNSWTVNMCIEDNDCFIFRNTGWVAIGGHGSLAVDKKTGNVSYIPVCDISRTAIPIAFYTMNESSETFEAYESLSRKRKVLYFPSVI